MTERELLKKFVESMPNLGDAVATVPVTMAWTRRGHFVDTVANSYGDRKVQALQRVETRYQREDVTWLIEFWQVARALLGYEVFGVRVLPPVDFLQPKAPAFTVKTLPYLRGNYESPVFTVREREPDITDQFEARALSVLGGSICYVQKKRLSPRGFEIKYNDRTEQLIYELAIIAERMRRAGEWLPEAIAVFREEALEAAKAEGITLPEAVHRLWESS